MNKYAQKMFTLTSDERMLYRAMESLKGEAAGLDGVRLEDLPNYVVYRQWLSACGLHGKKAPRYADTGFPNFGDDALYLVALLCDPEQLHAAQEVDMDGMKWMVASPRDPLSDREFAENRAALMKFRDAPPTLLFESSVAHLRTILAEAAERHMEPCVTNTKYAIAHFVDVKVLKVLLPKVGFDTNVVSALAKLLSDGLGKLVSDRHLYNAKIFFRSYAPFKKLLDSTRRPEILTQALLWNAARWIRDLLKKMQSNGKGYRPGEMRIVEIPKPDGGVRRLSLPSIVDRVVSKSALLVLQPVMEEVFLPSSVGCRYDRDRFHALAALNDRYPSSPGKILVTADIKKAFDHVPHDPLLQTIAKYVPNADMRTLLERIIRRPGFEGGIGIAQGDPLSPLFLNMLLHDHLDTQLELLMKENQLVYFRYVDDLCVFGLKSRAEAQAVIGKLQELLRPIGLAMHTEPPKTQITNLAIDSAQGFLDGPADQLDEMADWVEGADGSSGEKEVDRYLGVGLRGGGNGRLIIFLPSSWRKRLCEMYVRAEENIRRGGYRGTPGAHTHIAHATESWLMAFSPALSAEPEEETIGEIIEICRSVSSHTDGMKKDYLKKVWASAKAWWIHRSSEAP